MRQIALGLLAAAFLVGCASYPQPRVPPPMTAGGAPPSAAQSPPRAPRATPVAEVRNAPASGDVVQAGQEYIKALFAADDVTATLYQPGFGPTLRKEEDKYRLLDVDARPMTWSEAGYVDADPDLEFAEVTARVEARDGTTAGRFYYKVGFKRADDAVTVDMVVTRIDVR